MTIALTLPMFLGIGVCAGILAGLFGVGGGLIIVPVLVLIGGYTQVAATGTSLVALLLPIGSFIGAKLSLAMPDYILKRAFCIFMLFVAARMWMMTVPK